ncbi:8-hydroxygeraniol oxidoreductase isoform X1 [Hevea brasiliensis]|uniref:8-hydroxygeraniol oxidoreductase isoform X1 n=1 Tax=Hevea brasiliensis TaxID=3981 RepID=UPI0025ECE795|nr:8-hydroxygeraniol oxidoreductase isoform X1 [Hevea brasiliensis]
MRHTIFKASPIQSMAMSRSSNTSQVITCKAAVIWGVGEELKVEEIQVDPPNSSEVRVKMLYASICHTDISRAHGFPFPLFPGVLGHEGVGVVESIGDKVNGLKEGDVVIPTFLAQCQECENCTSQETNLCLKFPLNLKGLMPDDTSRMSITGHKLYHLFTCSTWSEYMVIDSNYVATIDPTIPLPYASILSCGFSTGFGAAWKEAKVKEGSTVAVLGLGAVGLGATEGARMQGAATIIGVDKNSKKREKGQAFGMTHFINPDEFDKPISQLVKDLTGGLGVDYCFECSGAAPLVNEALQSTKMGIGKAIAIGSGNAAVTIDFLPLLTGRTLKGSLFGGLTINSDLPYVLDKCKNKEFHLDELLTHEVSLQDIDKAFEMFKQPDCVKVLIKIH